MEHLYRAKSLLLLGSLVSLLSAVLLTGCGGGGGAAPSPIAEAVVNGVVEVPSGTPRSRDLSGGAPLPNATIRAYLTTQPTTPIAQTTTDADGRYTLRLPQTAVGKDILIVAEKTVSGQRVRVMGLVAALPPQGYAGANLDATTTLATEEILRYARSQGLSQLSPNGIAVVIDQIRERTRDLNTLSLVVGQTLPETVGDGILLEDVRNRVRPRVEENGNNLRAPTGDVAVAKSMMQMMRDMGLSVTDRGEDEVLRVERKVREQDDILREDIIQPLDAFANRGFRFFERVVGLKRGVRGIDGLAPGRYRERFYDLQRIGDTDSRTWVIVSEDGQLTCTIQTQNALQEFNALDAGNISFSVRKQGDSRFQYNGALEVAQRDSLNNITRLHISFTFTDSGLSQPIRVNGELNAANYSGNTPRSLQFSGNLTSQYADLTITNLQATAYESSERIRQITAGRIQVQVKSRRTLSVDIQNFTVAFDDAEPSDKHLRRIVIGALTATGIDSTLELRNWEIDLQTIAGEPGELEPFPVHIVRSELVFRTPNNTFSGTLQGRWENPVETRLVEEPMIPLSRFPRGSATFNGRVEPTTGRPVGLQFTLTSAPNQSPPQVTLTPRFELGTERIEGTLRAEIKVQSGMVNMQHEPFANATLEMTHTPSNFRIQISGSKQGSINRYSGTIVKPDGTVVAQIGNASALNLPDLGDQPIVRYTDGTFETLASLLL
jgi:hypothetical protein